MVFCHTAYSAGGGRWVPLEAVGDYRAMRAVCPHRRDRGLESTAEVVADALRDARMMVRCDCYHFRMVREK